MAGGTGQAYAVPQTEIGLAIETVKGTPEATPQYAFPVKSPKYEIDLTEIPDDTLQGSMVKVYDLTPGLRYDKHGWSAYPLLDSFPLLIRGELGSADTMIVAPAATTLSAAVAPGAGSISVAATIPAGSYVVIGTGGSLETHITGTPTGAGPFTIPVTPPIVYNQASGAAVTGLTQHQFSLLNVGNAGNQPPSFTLWDYDGEQWRQMAACQMDELNLKGNATGLVEYTISLMGNPASTNVTAPTISYTDVTTPPPWTFSANINGNILDTIVEWEIDLKRGTKPIPSLTGTQEYFEYFAGAIEATAKLTFVEQSGSPYLADFITNTNLAFSFTIFDQVSGNALTMNCAKALAKSGSLDRSKEWVEVPLDLQLLPSATNALAGGKSPLQMTVANTVVTSY